SGRMSLSESKTPDEQAARATDLARAYDRAIEALAGAASSRGQRAAIAPVSAALTRARAAYLQLASAARGRDRAGYDRGRRDVALSEQALGGTLARLAA